MGIPSQGFYKGYCFFFLGGGSIIGASVIYIGFWDTLNCTARKNTDNYSGF